jgi:hypothetical protein
MGFMQESGAQSRINVNFRNALIAVCLGSTAWGAAALSLGNARGAVVLGRSVDLAFDIHTDPDQTLESACITAKMRSGDNPVADGRVRVTPLPQVPGRTPAVRVQSSVPAVEPVLTVELQAGCTGKIARTYTFLADLPDTVASSARPIAIPLAGGAEAAGPALQGAPAAGSPPAERRTAATVPLAQDTAAAPVPRARAAAAPVAAAPAAPRPRPVAPVARKTKRPADPAPAPAAPRSRLVMEPLENWLESPSTLRLSTELNLPETPATPEQREQAQAQWKALSMHPEELLKEGARTAALNGELAQLRTQAAQDRATALQLLERLEKEKSERYSGTIVYLLLAMLVVMAALAAWIATRLRAVSLQAQDAWAAAVAQQPPRSEMPGESTQDSGPAALQDLPSAPASLAPSPVLPEPPQPAPRAPEAPALDIELVAPIGGVSVSYAEPAAVVAQPALLINPEELFDLQQQAEFFVSVGEHDQAIGVLKKYIATNETTAPAAYLELLRLYRSLSRVDDFNQLRAQFHRHFNALVPEFASFNRPGRPLLWYPEVLAQIEAIWSHESVLPLLDGLLFRHGETAPERFDLAAYDDLLLLNAIARTTPPSARGAPPPRERTTPFGGVVDAPAVPAAATPASGAPAVNLLDNGDSLLEYDSSWLLDEHLKPAQSGPAAVAPEETPSVAKVGTLIDFDLSEPFTSQPVPLPPLTQSDLPPVPASSAPAPGQPIGFGANNDRFEARFDLEPRKPE